MAYYVRATSGLNKDTIEVIGSDWLLMDKYLKVDKSRISYTDTWGNAQFHPCGFFSQADYFRIGCPCVWLDYNGTWELLLREMFTQEEQSFLEMVIPDLEWWG